MTPRTRREPPAAPSLRLVGAPPASGLGRRAAVCGGLILLVTFVWSAIEPCGRFTWWLESSPVLLGLPVAAWIHRRMPLDRVSLALIWLCSMMMLVGAHYTFAEVPLGDWIRDAIGGERNAYDRLGHVFQGVLPAMVVRGLLLRGTALRRGPLLFVLCCCVALSVSALYELAECAVALITGDSAHDFLGTQGDVWDSQWDMACALFGAIAAQLLLSRGQDRALRPAP